LVHWWSLWSQLSAKVLSHVLCPSDYHSSQWSRSPANHGLSVHQKSVPAKWLTSTVTRWFQERVFFAYRSLVASCHHCPRTTVWCADACDLGLHGDDLRPLDLHLGVDLHLVASLPSCCACPGLADHTAEIPTHAHALLQLVTPAQSALVKLFTEIIRAGGSTAPSMVGKVLIHD